VNLPLVYDVSTDLATVPSVLVVDGDAVSRRFVELSLTRGGLSVELAHDATSALDILSTNLVDLIICDTELPDVAGVQFLRRLGQESRLARIPFVFLSVDARVDTKLVAMRAGADDYLTKPVDGNELALRIESTIGRHRRARSEARRKSYLLAGDFSAIPFTDLVGILEMSRRTGVLSISAPCGISEIFFDNGRIVHATFGNLSGPPAFYRMVAEGAGQFEFLISSICEVEQNRRTISTSATSLILEGARLADDDKKAGTARVVPSRRPSLKSVPSPIDGLIRTTQPSAALARAFEAGISAGFSLAELRIFTREELAAWACTPVGSERFQVVLRSDLTTGASGLLSIAAPITERYVLSSLRGEQKYLGANFFLRQDRVVDLILIDIQQLSTIQASLSLEPSLVVLAPPGGDVLGMGTSSRAQLDAFLSRLEFKVLLGVGQATLQEQFKDLAALQNSNIKTKWVKAALGEGASDLRTLLVHGIRLWGSETLGNSAGKR